MSSNISRELINSLSGSGRRLVAVLKTCEAYLDESGTHKVSKVLCVAGYVGNRREWYKFEKEWQKVLDDAEISCFHAHDPKCASIKLPLASAIEKRNLNGVICGVNPDIFNTYTNMQFKSVMGNAYAACTFVCALEICKQAKEMGIKSVSFFIEDGQPNIKFVERVLKSLIYYPPVNITGVMVGKKNEFIPLQTADFLSHVYSTHERDWLEYLMRSKKVKQALIQPNNLNEVSLEIKDIFRQRRNLIRRMKRS